MIESLYNREVTRLRRLDVTRNSDNEYEYQASTIPCLYTKTFGKQMAASSRIAGGGKETFIQIDGSLMTAEPLEETDHFVIDGFEYRIAEGGLEPLDDLMTGAVNGFQASLTRERRYNEDTASIRSVNSRKEVASG